jgi:hypothetical protein
MNVRHATCRLVRDKSANPSIADQFDPKPTWHRLNASALNDCTCYAKLQKSPVLSSGGILNFNKKREISPGAPGGAGLDFQKGNLRSALGCVDASVQGCRPALPLFVIGRELR